MVNIPFFSFLDFDFFTPSVSERFSFFSLRSFFSSFSGLSLAILAMLCRDYWVIVVWIAWTRILLQAGELRGKYLARF